MGICQHNVDFKEHCDHCFELEDRPMSGYLSLAKVSAVILQACADLGGSAEEHDVFKTRLAGEVSSNFYELTVNWNVSRGVLARGPGRVSDILTITELGKLEHQGGL